MASSGKHKCFICKQLLGKNDKLELTTECDHTFHVACVLKRIDEKKIDCKVCRKKSALTDAFNAYKMTWKKLPRLDPGPIIPEKSASCSDLHEVSNNTSLYQS
jgi:hypothetical protein